MKREKYTVTYGDKSFVKFTWNSAHKQIESVVREYARAEHCFYRRRSSTCDAEHTHGVVIWEGDNGRRLTFVIQKAKGV